MTPNITCRRKLVVLYAMLTSGGNKTSHKHGNYMDAYRKAHQDHHSPQVDVFPIDVSQAHYPGCTGTATKLLPLLLPPPRPRCFANSVLVCFKSQANRFAYLKIVFFAVLAGLFVSLLKVACGRQLLPQNLAMCGTPLAS